MLGRNQLGALVSVLFPVIRFLDALELVRSKYLVICKRIPIVLHSNIGSYCINVSAFAVFNFKRNLI